MERVDELASSPLVGSYYLVPTVRGAWYGIVRDWPVMGAKHEDEAFFRFAAKHYHLDRRFLPERIGGYLNRNYGGTIVRQKVSRTLRDAIGAPLSESHPGSNNLPENDPLPAPVYRRRLCRRAEMFFPLDSLPVVKMQEHFAGTQCKHGKRGWICPHRGFALGSIQPNADGFIICPLHGLQIDAESGRVGIVPVSA